MLPHLVDAPIGIKLGTHHYGTNRRGENDTRVIIRKADGATFLGHISKYEMARSSRHAFDADLFRHMYEFLSEYTHPTFTSLQLVLTDTGRLDPLANELNYESLLYSMAFATMVLDEVASLGVIARSVRKDLRTVARRIARKVIEMVKHSSDEALDTPHIRTFLDRIGVVANDDESG